MVITKEEAKRLMKEQRRSGGPAKDTTKREYFAGLAMAGMISNSTIEIDTSNETIAKVSVAIADALLAELAKGEGA